jgi:dCMP deaminase
MTDVSFGYNGFPQGCNDSSTLLSFRPARLARTIHAELNAILKARESLIGYRLYCTRHPCAQCAAAIVQVKIGEVYYKRNEELEERWKDSIAYADQLFAEGKVKVFWIE